MRSEQQHPLADLIIGDQRVMVDASRVGGSIGAMQRASAQVVEPRCSGTTDDEQLYGLSGEMGRYYFGGVCVSQSANDCPIASLDRARKNGHALVWCSQTASVLDGTVKTVRETIDTDRPVAFMGRAYAIVRGGNNTPSLRQIDARRYLNRDTRGEGPRFESRKDGS